jgi:acylphosphatase
MAEQASLKAIIHGRVHGVFFRAFAARQATRIGLTGYVRNLPDGTVEVQAEGERSQLEELIGHLEIGPPAAKVDKVVTSWSKYTGKYSGFNVTY